MAFESAFFSGWLGYGSSTSPLQLVEPQDSSYARRPILYGSLDGFTALDVSTGSIGPAETSWVNLSVAGLYDSMASGQLLAIIPLSPIETVQIGMTLTDFRRFTFRLSYSAGNPAISTCSWIAGSELGRTEAGLLVLAACNVQVSGGVLSAIGDQTPGLSVSSLPSVAPASGSGQLWNNGGVICIA